MPAHLCPPPPLWTPLPGLDHAESSRRHGLARACGWGGHRLLDLVLCRRAETACDVPSVSIRCRSRDGQFCCRAAENRTAVLRALQRERERAEGDSGDGIITGILCANFTTGFRSVSVKSMWSCSVQCVFFQPYITTFGSTVHARALNTHSRSCWALFLSLSLSHFRFFVDPFTGGGGGLPFVALLCRVASSTASLRFIRAMSNRVTR